LWDGSDFERKRCRPENVSPGLGLSGGPYVAQAKVLVVDDSPMISRLLQSKLGAAGIASDASDSAAKALQMMERNLYFVVVADIHMPGTDGVALLSALKRLSPLVQVIMLTGDASIEQVIECADRGAIDFFSKQEPLPPLTEAVASALARAARWSGWLRQGNTAPVALAAAGRKP